MLLNEITTSDDLKIKKINDVLQKTYGFTLVSEVKSGTLNSLYTQIADDLYDLKLDLSTAKSPNYMQKVLVLEGLKILIKKNNTRLEEEVNVIAGKGGRAFQRILNDLTAFVDKVCEMGDDYEEAIKDAMKHYRSSKYRFSDEVVEYELRKTTVDDCTDTVLDEVCGSIHEETKCCSKCDCDPCECETVNEAEEVDEEVVDEEAEEITEEDVDEEDVDEEVIEESETSDRFMGMAPQERWWENDPNDLMSFLYWKQSELPPSGRAFELQWKKVVDQLSKSNPPPSDWVNPIADSGPSERKCPNCYGHGFAPGYDGEMGDEPCHKCDGSGKVTEDGVEESGDRHAEHDWVRTMKQDAGISEPGYHDDSAGGLSLENPDEQQDDADDFFSYQAKKTNKKRTEMKEGYVKELRKLLEAETDQAESLIAAKSFSQELQDMVEKLGRLVNENLPAVSEQMRDAYGSDVATGFEDLVSGTLNSVMDSLRQSKQEIDNSVSTIADGGAPVAGTDMESYSDEELGGEFDADLDLDGDVELALDDELVGDEFGGDDAVAGLEDEPLGRAKKEALVIIGKKLVETKAKLARIKAKQ